MIHISTSNSLKSIVWLNGKRWRLCRPSTRLSTSARRSSTVRQIRTAYPRISWTQWTSWLISSTRACSLIRPNAWPSMKRWSIRSSPKRSIDMFNKTITCFSRQIWWAGLHSRTWLCRQSGHYVQTSFLPQTRKFHFNFSFLFFVYTHRKLLASNGWRAVMMVGSNAFKRFWIGFVNSFGSIMIRRKDFDE